MGSLPSHFDLAAAHLVRAPFEAGRWVTALTATAHATGSGSACLVGWLASGEVFGVLARDQQAGMRRDWLEHGGNDPRRNPLVRHGMLSPLMREFSDEEVISPDERRRHPLWNEFYKKIGFTHYAVCHISRRGNGHLSLQVSRTPKQGPIEDGQRRVFRELARHWRNAATLSSALKSEGTRLLAGALDGLSLAAVVLDGFGRIVAMTPAAEKILCRGTLLRANSGGIAAAAAQESATLDAAVQGSLGNLWDAGIASAFPMRGRNGSSAHIRVSPLPRDNDIGFGAAAMIVIDKAGDPDCAPHTRPECFGLTPAETEVARAIISGRRATHIARERCVSIQTVRAQIKSIYAKAGLHSRAELMALRKV